MSKELLEELKAKNVQYNQQKDASLAQFQQLVGAIATLEPIIKKLSDDLESQGAETNGEVNDQE